MFGAFLLIVFSLFVFITGYHLIKRNILFGGVYFFLYIYSIFAQIGYYFLPELSMLAKAYFGQKYFFYFYTFNFLSFASFYYLCRITILKHPNIPKYKIVRIPKAMNYILFILFISLFFAYMLYFFRSNYVILNWANAADENFINSQGFGYRIFTMSFKTMSSISLLIYSQWRIKPELRIISYYNKYSLLFLFAIFVTLFVTIANKLGSRTDILAFALGVCVFEYQMGLNFRKIVKLLSFAILLGAFLLYIENTRTATNNEDLSFYQQLILKDYFAPAHMLYSAIALDYIKPLEVIASNLCNSLVKLNYPYLQAPLTDLINPGIATRSAGYAFYFFTEGFIFMGYCGFIYNALVLYLGLSIWNSLVRSDNKFYNYILISIMCTQFANIARSQSSNFIKDLYLLFLPILLLIYLSSGMRPKLFKKLKI